MAIKLSCLNAKSLGDRSKAARLTHDLLSFGVDVAVIREIHFVCDVDVCVLSSNFFFIYSVYRDRLAR